MRSLVEVIGKHVDLSANPVHVELGYAPTYLFGKCPFCLKGRLVVLLEEERWVCYGCLYGGTGAAGRRKFLEMFIARKQTDPARSKKAFDLKDADIP